MISRIAASLFFFAFAAALPAQMWSGTDTLYGNEWLDFSRPYFKIQVAEDGIYRVDFQMLADAGFPVGTVPGSQFRLWLRGQPVRMFTSTDGAFGPQDFLEFFGEKNRGTLDRHLFDKPDEEQVNPSYSIISDTSAYFLTWETGGQPLRFAATPNDLSNPPPKEPFCWFLLEKIYSGNYIKRRASTDFVHSWYDGDGYGRGAAATHTLALSPKKVFVAGPAATGRVRFVGNLGKHEVRTRLANSAADSLLFSDKFEGWKIIEHEFVFPANWLTTSAKYVVEAVANDDDKVAVPFASVKYPRLWDAENLPEFTFSLAAKPAERSYFELAKFDATGGALPLLFDLTNGLRLETRLENNLVKAALPPASAERKLFLVNPNSGIKKVTKLRRVLFRNLADAPADFVILTHPALRKATDGSDPVADYAAYRSSPAGGGFSVNVLDVNELCDQFGYGESRHPQAVRNFVHWAKRAWPQPKYLFFIGKGMETRDLRDPSDAAIWLDSLAFLPTAGFYASDLPFVLGNRPGQPALSVGRLAATRPEQIADYLNKVREHESALASAPQTIADRAWMKRVLHLNGGKTTDAPAIKNSLSQMRNVLETNRFGAAITSFEKTSNDPVQTSAYEQILENVNSGTAMMTIFGHSSSQVVDFDIGQAAAYRNAGRYPFMFVMGCLSGGCSAPLAGLGEDFTLADGRGAVAYLASVFYADILSLRTFGVKFYETIGGAGYGKSLGEQIGLTISALAPTAQSPGLRALLNQIQLQGDPAVRLPAAPGADFLIDNQSVVFAPNPVGIGQGDFKLTFDVVNIGENAGGNFALRVQQRLPNDSLRTLVFDTLAAPANRQKFQFSLPDPGPSAVGFNRFFVRADAAEQVAELPAPAAEMNNELVGDDGQPGVAVYFFADDVQPVFPPDFGIVGQADVTLRASTLNTDAPPQRYFFEFDTTAQFDSPAKLTTQVWQRGGLISWKIPQKLPENRVFYWRVARDSLQNGQVVWRTASFAHLPGSPPGWNQSHLWQFRQDSFENLALDPATRRWQFAESAAHVSVAVAYRGIGQYLGIQNGFYEGGTGDIALNFGRVKRGIIVALVDAATGHILPNPPGSPTNPDTTGRTLFYHVFDTKEAAGRLQLMNFIEQEIPAGRIVGLLTVVNPANDTLGFFPESWAADSLVFGKNLFQVLENQGARDVRKLTATGSVPYGLIFQKDNPAFAAVDTLVTAVDSLVEIRRNFLVRWTRGAVESPPIGPAKNWGRLLWQHGGTDATNEDIRLKIMGLRPNRPDTLLLETAQIFDTSLAAIAADRFQFLKIRVEATDALLRTVPPIGHLRVLFEPLPEGALNPAYKFDFQADTLQQGQNLVAQIAFENVSQAAFADSLLVKFRVENEQGAGKDFWKKYAPLAPGDTLLAGFATDTRQFSGKNRLVVAANPDRSQPELHLFNNVSVREFFVARDQRNPLLDVTFDGQHLLDGDLVSPKPEIVVSLRDENPYLPLGDTAMFEIRLTHPDGSVENIGWRDPRVLFFPASAADLPKKNVARLEFRPEFVADGEYQLQVNGRDQAGNAAGTLDYSVRFRVITKSSLSSVLPYPNPFSTRTCFVYTMTGAESPAHFRIQIMTVAGRVVREITEADFGPLRPGTHVSDFCWDGRDEFGDQLANGVYLYRIVAKKADDSDFELFENQAVDGFFKGGVGKVVLLR